MFKPIPEQAYGVGLLMATQQYRQTQLRRQLVGQL